MIILLFSVLAVLAIAVCFRYLTDRSPRMEISFLDVGQGDATLIETPYGQNILIDAGEGDVALKRLGEELPWWDRTIDLAIVTHPHSDHFAGMIPVLRRYHVLQVMWNGRITEDADFKLWLELVENEGAKQIITDQPRNVVLGDGLSLESLYPISPADTRLLNLNETSIVLRLSYASSTILLMGDAETGTEARLIASGERLKADILKLGHHGSDTSSGQEFLMAVDADWGILSVGKDNKFGHPSPATPLRLRRQETEVLRTDEVGTIRFSCQYREKCVLK